MHNTSIQREYCKGKKRRYQLRAEVHSALLISGPHVKKKRASLTSGKMTQSVSGSSFIQEKFHFDRQMSDDMPINQH